MKTRWSCGEKLPRASRERRVRRRGRDPGDRDSCDETAAALIDARASAANVVSSQAELHARFGGVVPEVASRRHLELIVRD